MKKNYLGSIGGGARSFTCVSLLLLSVISLTLFGQDVQAAELLSQSQDIDSLISTVNSLSIDAYNLPVADTAPDSADVGAGQNLVDGPKVCTILTRTFDIGSRDTADNTDVSKLQTFLIQNKYLTRTVTGYYGPQTATAVRKFQIAAGIIQPNDSASYQVGPLSRTKIQTISCGSATNTNSADSNSTITIPVTTASGVNPASIELSDGRNNIAGIIFNNAKNIAVTTQSDATVTLSLPQNATLNFDTLEGLDLPFSWKGGSYPGNGGTCTQTITSSCTLVFTYTPASKPSLLTTADQDGTGSYSDVVIKLHYTDDQNHTGVSNAFILRGKSDALGVMTLGGTSPTHPIGTAFINQTLTYDLPYTKYDNTTRISWSPVSAPFYQDEIDTCTKATALLGNAFSCIHTFSFKPSVTGSFTQSATASYFDGLSQKNLSAGTFIGDTFKSNEALSADKNLLIVYNSRSADGKKIADYYTVNRPGFSNANVLAIQYPDPSCTVNCGNADDEIMSIPAFKQSLQDPISSWIGFRPEKSIRNIVLVRGIPTRIYSTEPPHIKTSSDWSGNVPDSISSLYTLTKYIVKSNSIATLDLPHKNSNILFTLLDMGSTDATLHYIDKLKSEYGAMQQPSLMISAQNGNQAGTTYYLEDVTERPFRKSFVTDVRDAISSVSNTTPIEYLNRNTSQPTASSYFKTASDVRGFSTWGANATYDSSHKNYAIDGSLTFSGISNWYLINTMESYNGERDIGFQANYVNWFSKNAFGGTNYDKTPAGAVAYVDEPLVDGINGPAYFACWEAQNLFADCAWRSNNGPMMIAIGDPWIKN